MAAPLDAVDSPPASQTHIVANLLTQAGRVALTVVTTAIMVVLLAPAELGKIYLAQSAAFMIARGVVFGLNRAGALLAIEHGPQVGVLVTTRACLRNAIIVAPVGGTLLLSVQLGSGITPRESIVISALSALWGVFAALSIVFAEVFRFSDRQAWALSLQGAIGGLAAGAIGSAALATVAGLNGSLAASETVLIMAVSSALPVSFAMYTFLPHSKILQLNSIQSQAQVASMAPGAAQIVQLVVAELPLWICSTFLGPAQAGAYGLANRIAGQAGTIPHVVATASSPAALSALQDAEARPALQRKLSRIYTPVGVFGLSGLVVLSLLSRLFEDQLPQTAVQAAAVLPIVGLPYVVMAFAGCPGYVLQLSAYVRHAVVAQIAGLVALITGLSASIALDLGLLGFATAAATAGVAASALEWRSTRRHLRFDASFLNLSAFQRRSRTSAAVSSDDRRLFDNHGGSSAGLFGTPQPSRSRTRRSLRVTPIGNQLNHTASILGRGITPGVALLCLYGALVPNVVLVSGVGATDLLAFFSVLVVARRPDIVSSPLMASYLGFVVLLLASSSAQLDAADAARAARVGVHFLPLILCISLARMNLSLVTRCVWFGGLGALFFAIVSYFSGWGASDQELFVGGSVGNIPRAAGVVGNTAPFSHLSATWLVFGVLIAPRWFSKPRLVQAVSTVTGLAAIILSSSRGGLLNIFVASFLLVAANLGVGSGRSRRTAGLTMGLGFAVIAALQLGPRVWSNPTWTATAERLNPFASASEDRVSTFFSSSGRTSTWPEVLSYIGSNPLGGGIKGFEGSTGLVIDSSYLAAFAWAGIIGGVLYALFWISILRWAWSFRHVASGLALYALVAGQMAQFLVGEFFTQWYSMPFAFLIIGIAMRETRDLGTPAASSIPTQSYISGPEKRPEVTRRVREASR